MTDASLAEPRSPALNILLGPAIFFLTLALPIFGPMEARIGFGILFWMVFWWVTVAVDIKITCLVPLIVVAFYPYMPIQKVMQAYVHKHAFLIIGASMVTAAWAHWGFAQRLALTFQSKISNSVQSQAVAWFLFCAILSFVMGNTPVGAVFAPIAAAALAYAGYKTFEDRYNSPAASNVLIAIAWGASIGGMATPLGGGQAVVTLGLFEKYIGQEIFFLEWTARMLPISLIITAAIALYIYFFMKPETETFAGGDKNFYKKELKKMGPMSYEEKVIGIGFLIILALAVTRPLYVDLIKGPYFKWLHFSPLFFIFASALFIIPSKASKGEYLLSGKIMAQHFPIAIIFIWPAAVALGRILNKTGASKVFAGWLEPLIGAGDVAAISAIALGSNVLSNMTSDTASAGVMIPLVIASFKEWGGLKYGAVPFIWIAGAALSWSYAVASATGAQGIVAGFGANLKRMFVFGLGAAAISIVVTALYFILTVGILELDFYKLPPV